MNKKFFFAAGASLALSCAALAQGTTFTYQGRLDSGGAPAAGTFDLRFALFNAPGGGTQITGPLTNSGVLVSNGVFTTTLDFGSAPFDGSDRWLEIGARTNGGGAFATLAPRQLLTATPYAIRAGNFNGTVTDSQLPADVARRSAAQAFTGVNTFSNTVRFAVPARMQNDDSFYLRGNSDSNHGVGYFGVGRSFGGFLPDGPVLFGWESGGLGSRKGGDHVVAMWNAAGNVGIGTTNPQSMLHVAGAVTALGFFGNGAGLTNIDASDLSVGVLPDARLSTNVARRSGGNTFSGDQLVTSGRVQVTGGVLARGGAPGGFGANNNGYAFSGNGGDNDSGLFCLSDGNLSLYADAVEIMRLTGGGNVGIGKTNPATKLDVAGDITAVAVNITSDRNAKEQFKAVDAREILERVAALPISEWQYKGDTGRHIGPMAQDFHAAFFVGRDERKIATVDADGVALAAIKGLRELVRERDGEVSRLKEANDSLAARLAAIEKMLGELSRGESGVKGGRP